MINKTECTSVSSVISSVLQLAKRRLFLCSQGAPMSPVRGASERAVKLEEEEGHPFYLFIVFFIPCWLLTFSPMFPWPLFSPQLCCSLGAEIEFILPFPCHEQNQLPVLSQGQQTQRASALLLRGLGWAGGTSSGGSSPSIHGWLPSSWRFLP